MSTQKRAAAEAVRLFPVPGAFIDGEPAVEREVSPEEAERLLSFNPPAYAVAPQPEPVAIEDDAEEPQE